jgi:glucose dehydrogenase
MNAQEFTSLHPDNPSSFFWPSNQKKERIEYFGAGHIVGTHRMGPRSDSAVDDMQRSWDHDNLYLVGSGSFPTVATGNPTLTIAALCLRTADHIARNVLK